MARQGIPVSFTGRTEVQRRVCSLCLQEKLVTDFYVRTDGRQAGNFSSRCRKCVGVEARQRRERLVEDQMVRAAKFRANKRGLAFDLDQYKIELRSRILSGCELTGLPFAIKGKRDWNSPSVDRIKPEQGYVLSNVRIILWGLNSAFGYWGEEVTEVFARAWLGRKTW